MTSSPVTAGRRPSARHNLLVAGRFFVGYVLAVAAGALVFAATAELFVPELTPFSSPEQTGTWGLIVQSAYFYFILGLFFGIPYTLLGSIAFWFWTRRRAVTFWLIGTFCPAAAILVMFSLLRMISLDWKMLQILLATLPAGFVATYVYGAIGFGGGFGRWRFG